VLSLKYEQQIKKLIEFLIKEEGIEVHAIDSRVKEKDSLSRKLKKKGNKYNNLEEITDILGLRIITYFEDDVDRIAEILKKQFHLDEENSIDKRKKNDPSVFGYSSLHYILTLNELRASLPEYSNYKDLTFELQIRSILQHAWAEIEHDIGYKSKYEIPGEIRRDFSRIAGLLELADKEFIRLKDFLKGYAENVEKKIQNHSLDLEINKITLQEFLNKSSEVKEIREQILSDLKVAMESDIRLIENDIRVLKFFEINSIAELDSVINLNRDKIIEFGKEWMKEYDDDTIKIDASITLFYLYYVLVYQDYSIDYLTKYLEISSMSDVAYDEFIERFEELKREGFEL
jgi:ppGpp synthetase/RelA/SpoT-type nucleotidyltranferase